MMGVFIPQKLISQDLTSSLYPFMPQNWLNPAKHPTGDGRSLSPCQRMPASPVLPKLAEKERRAYQMESPDRGLSLAIAWTDNGDPHRGDHSSAGAQVTSGSSCALGMMFLDVSHNINANLGKGQEIP